MSCGDLYLYIRTVYTRPLPVQALYTYIALYYSLSAIMIVRRSVFYPRPAHVGSVMTQWHWTGRSRSTSVSFRYHSTNASYPHCIHLPPTLYNLSKWVVKHISHSQLEFNSLLRLTLQNVAVTIRRPTTHSNKETRHFTTQDSCVPYGPQKEERLFPCTAISK
jgi:hypothetical protein